MTDDEKYDPFKMRVKPLTANNYFVWSNEMEIILRGKGLWEFVSESAEASDEEGVDLEVGPNRKRNIAHAYTLMSIDDSCKASVLVMRDPVAVWKKLKDTYQAVSEASIDAKLSKLQHLKMKSQRR